MFNFFKRSKEYPAFTDLKDYSKKDQYFIRMAPWRWLNKEQITVTDPHNPRMITMDAWPQAIFLAANGQRTIYDFVFFMADQYSGDIPPELDKTIIDEIEILLSYKIIGLSDKKQRLEKAFDDAAR